MPLAEDALYQIRFNLPDTDGQSVEIGAHVLWRDDASAPGQSWAGLRFLGLAPQATRSLREWVGRGSIGGGNVWGNVAHSRDAYTRYSR